MRGVIGHARIEFEDGTLLEGRIIRVEREEFIVHHSSPHFRPEMHGVAEPHYHLTLVDPTTTHDWRRHHEAGEDMGTPITRKPAEPEKPKNPAWGTFA